MMVILGIRRLGLPWIFLLGLPVFAPAQEAPSVQVFLDPPSPVIGETVTLRISFTEGDGWTLRAPRDIPDLRGFRLLRAEVDGNPGGPDPDPSDPPSGTSSIRYSLLAVRSGFQPLPSLVVGRAPPGDTVFSAVQIPLGGVMVGSVLPPPGQEANPTPLIEPMGDGDDPSPWLPVSLAGSLVFAVAWAWTRSTSASGLRRDEETTGGDIASSVDPTAMLRFLQRLSVDSAVEDPNWDTRVDEGAVTLRGYLHACRPILEESFTTSELSTAWDPLWGEPRIIGLLEEADALRFGPKPPPTGKVAVFWSAVADWARTEMPNRAEERQPSGATPTTGWTND